MKTPSPDVSCTPIPNQWHYMTVLTLVSCLGQQERIHAAEKYGVLMSTLHASWLGILYSGLTLAGSPPLAAAAHGLCSSFQCIHTRATLGWEAQCVGITRRFASKTHSSCKLEHDGIIPWKYQVKKNGSLLLPKDRNHRKRSLIAGKGL